MKFSKASRVFIIGVAMSLSLLGITQAFSPSYNPTITNNQSFDPSPTKHLQVEPKGLTTITPPVQPPTTLAKKWRPFSGCTVDLLTATGTCINVGSFKFGQTEPTGELHNIEWYRTRAPTGENPYTEPFIPEDETWELTKTGTQSPQKTAAPQPLASQRPQSSSSGNPNPITSQSIRKMQNPIMFLAICAVGSMIWSLGLWSEPKLAKEAKEKGDKSTSSEEKKSIEGKDS